MLPVAKSYETTFNACRVAMRERPKPTDYALLVLRMAGLLLALGHGWGKIYGLTTGAEGFIGGVERLGLPLPQLFAWAAALSEFVGGLLVAAGLLTRAAAFFAACTMATAVFARHQALLVFGAWIGVISPDPEALRAAGSPERALLFLVIMLAVMLMGAGSVSLDRMLADRRR